LLAGLGKAIRWRRGREGSLLVAGLISDSQPEAVAT